MAVAFDTSTESVKTNQDLSHFFNHTPVGTVRGVVVSSVFGTATGNIGIIDVSYGTTLLTRVQNNSDTAGEPGASELWFSGNVSELDRTGLKSVTINTNGALGLDEDVHYVCMTFTGNTNLQLVDNDGVSEDAANPSVTLQYNSRICISVACLYGGGAAPSSFVQNANCTAVHDHDFGLYYSSVIRQTTPGSADFAIGGTSVSDDVAFSAIAISEATAVTDSNLLTGWRRGRRR
jgi:hypothetical protein